MPSTKKRITAALTIAILATTLAIPTTAAEAPTIRVSSYKGIEAYKDRYIFSKKIIRGAILCQNILLR